MIVSTFRAQFSDKRTNMKWLLAAVAIILAQSCVGEEVYTVHTAPLPAAPAQPPSGRIIGGVAASIEKYPFAVQLLVNTNALLCGGSLITARHVLSAAHCLFDSAGRPLSPNAIAVLAGATYTAGTGTRRSVSMYILHERYNSPVRDNDIAVLVLSAAFPITSTIQAATLPGANLDLPNNTPVWHIGWGVTSPGANLPSPVLNEAQVFTINNTVCFQRYATLSAMTQRPYPVTDSMLCSGVLDQGGRDACQGDSGGPLVYNSRFVVGVTSWGEGCASATYPGVNAKVSRYTTWILQTVARYNSSTAIKSSGVLLLTLLFAVMFKQ